MLSPILFENHESLSIAAADLFLAKVREKPDSLFCLATGQTPLRTYQLIAQRGSGSLGEARILKLDEWGGIPMNSPATCESFLRSSLVQPLGLEKRYVGFHSEPEDPTSECQRIAEWLRKHGPIDVCVLGLGLNGHLGFNEPASALQPHAHLATLSQESLRHSMIEREPIKPTFGLTLGMADILQAREILMLVSGSSKAEPLRRMLSGPISTEFPASFLELHSRVTLLVDRPAACKLGT